MSESEQEKTTVHASTVFLGFTGPIGSGCTYIAKTLAENHGYEYRKLSDIIRNYVDPEDKHNVEKLQDKGDQLRKENRVEFLVEETINDLQSLGKKIDKVIIDGIKNSGEVEALRAFSNFFLFSVHAEKETRCNRTIEDGIFKNEDEFNSADLRDQLGDDPKGQQVPRCDYLSDIIILNSKQIPKPNLERKERFVEDIYWDYVKPIEEYAFYRRITFTPKVDELCMTMAYSVSRMSSCLKRKVGAIITKETKVEVKEEEKKEKHWMIPTVVSSGYNDVPLGQKKCVFEKYEMCYRDLLQQEHASKYNYCPECGKPIIKDFTCTSCGSKLTEFLNKCPHCNQETKIKYTCQCGVEVFNEHIPGAKNSPGKLLDMCRALHAEEVAILNLIQNGIASEGLVLYTTTQPCNMCANKIVNSGIKKVVYSEPYTMKEADDILKERVEVVRFQGIKSNAFFKLFKT